MKRLIPFISSVLFMATVWAGDDMPTISVGDMRGIADAIKMDGVAGYVEGKAQKALEVMISKEGTSWMCDAFANAINNVRKDGGASIQDLLRQDEAMKGAVQAELKQDIKKWLPKEVERIIKDDLFGMAMQDEDVKEAVGIAQRINGELDKTLNEKLDDVVGGMYEETVGELRREVMESGGRFLQWVDVSDMRGTVKKAFDISNAAELTSLALGKTIGEATVAGIRSNITDMLNGELPGEVVDALSKGPEYFEKYISEVSKYLPGETLNRLTGSILNRSVIDLPSSGYAAILAATAAGHYVKAFTGPVVDAYELKRAAEVTKVMVWQLENKKYLSISIMELASISKELANAVGAGALYDNALERIKEPFDRLKAMTSEMDQMMLKPLNDIRTEMEKISGDIQKELLNIQEGIMQPVRENLDRINNGLHEVSDLINNSIPEGFNGLPASFDELKEMSGVDGGILGEFGDLSPGKELREISQQLGLTDAVKNLKEDLNKLNDKIAGGLANAGASALYGAGALGPVASIMDIERVPAKNESVSGELDPVYLHNGEFFQRVTDVVIPGRGLDFRWTRIHRSRGNFLGELGLNTTHSYAERLLVRQGQVTYIDDEGRKFLFQVNGDEFVGPKDLDWVLVKRSDNYTISKKDGAMKLFDLQGRIKKICDRYENCVKLEYGDTGLVNYIIDVYGRGVNIIRRDDGLISDLEDFAGRRWIYLYNDEKELIGVTTPATPDFPKGKTTAYRYTIPMSGGHAMSMVMDPNGVVYLENRYDDEGRVTFQRYGEGPWMAISYAKVDNDNIVSRTWVTDKTGVVRAYEHGADGRLISKWEWLGETYKLITRYAYNNSGDIIESCDEDNRCQKFEYKVSYMGEESVSHQDCPSNEGVCREERYIYDKTRRPKEIIDYGGIRTIFEYTSGNNGGECVRVKRGKQKEEYLYRYCLNGMGQTVAETDGRGVVTRYDYYSSSDPDGDGIDVVNADKKETGGYLSAVVIDAEGGESRTAAGPVLSRKTSYVYDAVGNITKVIYPDGVVVDLKVNVINQVVEEKDPRFARRIYSYDQNDNLVKITYKKDKRDIVDHYKYDALGRLVESKLQIDENRYAETKFVYDLSGRLIKKIRPEGNELFYGFAIKKKGYDIKKNGFGEIISVIDPLLNLTAYERDVYGRIVRVKNIDNGGKKLGDTIYSYDEDGDVTQIIRKLWYDNSENVRDVVTAIAYDASKNVSSVCVKDDRCKYYEWNGANEVVATIDADGVREEYVRDVVGRVVAVKRNKKIIVEYIIMQDGKCVSITKFNRTSRSCYDEMGDLENYIAANGTEIKYERDDLGRVLSLVKGTKEKRQSSHYSWDANGNLKSLTNPLNETVRFEYNDKDRVVKKTGPMGVISEYIYDGNGNIKKYTGYNRIAIDVEYDKMDRMVARTATDLLNKALTVRQKFAYDGLGRIIFGDNTIDELGNEGRSEFVYDSLSRAVAESSQQRWLARKFDDSDLLTGLSYPSNNNLNIMHTKGGRVLSIKDPSSEILSVLYKNGDVTKMDLKDIITFQPISNDKVIAYNYIIKSEKDDGWADSYNGYFADDGGIKYDLGPDFIHRTYKRDLLGRLISAKDYREDESPDSKVEVKNLWEFNYDDNNDVINTTKEIGTIKRDGLGNIIRVGRYEYTYDALKRLVNVKENGISVASYKYDVFDRLREIKTAKETRQFVWDGWQLVEYKGEDGRIVNYGYIGDDYLPWFALEDGKIRYLLRDRVGSIRRVVDESGQVVSSCGYSPYGETLTNYDTESCDKTADSFGFSYGIDDNTSGLIYMRHRFYHPKLKTFLTADPLGVKVAQHLAPNRFMFPALSYHLGSGAASHATFSDRAIFASNYVGPLPYGRAILLGNDTITLPETSPFVFANADPSQFVDILGLAELFFDESDKILILATDKRLVNTDAVADVLVGDIYGEKFLDDFEILGTYDAANNVEKRNRNKDPYQIGGNGPFPNGTYPLGVPEFYSTDIREDFYARNNFGKIQKKESMGNYGWQKNREDTYYYSATFGQIRIRTGGKDDIAFDRQLFIHGGRYDYLHPTYGCIRADDNDLENLAAEFIRQKRSGDPVTQITVRK